MRLSFSPPAKLLYPESDCNPEGLASILSTLNMTEVIIEASIVNGLANAPMLNNDPGTDEFHGDTPTQHIKTLNHICERYFTEASNREIARWVAKNNIHKPSQLCIFSRAALIELIRCAVEHCREGIEPPGYFASPDRRYQFGKAAIVANSIVMDRMNWDSILSQQSSYFDRIVPEAKVRAWSRLCSVCMEPLTLFVRSQKVFSDFMFSHQPSDLASDVRECDEAAKFFEHRFGMNFEDYLDSALFVYCMHSRFGVENDISVISRHRTFSPYRSDIKNRRFLSAFHKFCTQWANDLRPSSILKTKVPSVIRGKGVESSHDLIKQLYEKPIFRAVDDRHVVVDPIIYAEAVAQGTYFSILGDIKGNSKSKFGNRWGKSFERYCQWLLRAMMGNEQHVLIDDSPKITNRLKANKESQLCDIAIAADNVIILIECKAVFLTESAFGIEANGLAEELWAELTKKYTRGKGKLMGQLATACVQTLRGNTRFDVSTVDAPLIVPVLLTWDDTMSGRYFDSVFREEFHWRMIELPNNDQIANRARNIDLVTLSISTLEHMGKLFLSGGLFNLLRSWHEIGRCDRGPFEDFAMQSGCIDEYPAAVFSDPASQIIRNLYAKTK